MSHHRQLEHRLAAIAARCRTTPAELRDIVERLAGAVAEDRDAVRDELQRRYSPAAVAQGAALAAQVVAALNAAEGDEFAVIGHTDHDLGEDEDAAP